MSLLTIILASLAALEHLYIFYLESIRTTSDTTSRVFNMDKEELARPSVTSLFKNQGIYNALIGVFLLYGLFVSKNSEVVTIFVLFIIGTAAYGAMTANKKIILTQGGPAILALLSTYCWDKKDRPLGLFELILLNKCRKKYKKRLKILLTL